MQHLSKDALSNGMCKNNQFQMVLEGLHDEKKNLRIFIWTDNEMIAGCGVTCIAPGDPDCEPKIKNIACPFVSIHLVPKSVDHWIIVQQSIKTTTYWGCGIKYTILRSTFQHCSPLFQGYRIHDPAVFDCRLSNHHYCFRHNVKTIQY